MFHFWIQWFQTYIEDKKCSRKTISNTRLFECRVVWNNLITVLLWFIAGDWQQKVSNRQSWLSIRTSNQIMARETQIKAKCDPRMNYLSCPPLIYIEVTQHTDNEFRANLVFFENELLSLVMWPAYPWSILK